MEYRTPMLRLVGTAQTLVLHGGQSQTLDNLMPTSRTKSEEVLGLDD